MEGFPMAASAPLVAALDVGWLRSALEAYVFFVPLYVIYLVAVLGGLLRVDLPSLWHVLPGGHFLSRR